MYDKKKIMIAIGVFALISVLMIVLAILFRETDRSNETVITDSSQNSYVDPDSGELVLNPEGWVDEGLIEGPLLLGFYNLVDMGLTSQQFGLSQTYIKEYVKDHTYKDSEITQISLVKSSLKQKVNTKTGQKDILADIRINRDGLQDMVVSYIGVSDLLLRIYEHNTKRLIYISNSDSH